MLLFAVSFARQAFWTHFCARQVFEGSFSAHHTKSVATPGVGGWLACLHTCLAATSMDLPLHVVQNPPLKVINYF